MKAVIIGTQRNITEKLLMKSIPFLVASQQLWVRLEAMLARNLFVENNHCSIISLPALELGIVYCIVKEEVTGSSI
jgi:hypothetical protein